MEFQGEQGFQQTTNPEAPVPGVSLSPAGSSRHPPLAGHTLIPSFGTPPPLPCPTGLGARKAHGHSLKVTVDVHPAILGDADEEGVQGNLHVLEMHGHKCTKESDPEHGEYLREKPEKMPGLDPRTLQTGHAHAMQMNTAKGMTGSQAHRPPLFSRHP